MDGELLCQWGCFSYWNCCRKEGDTWKQFCTLSNVNGQKYTIGNTFTSREEQGEFIFLPSDISGTQLEGFACEINVENGKFFVSPVSENPTIFLNDDIEVWIKTELRFGDSLSLGNDKPNIFRFPERQLNSDAPRTTTTAVATVSRSRKSTVLKDELPPVQNGLILSNILSYLSVKELKSARFVSKLWNEEGFKILKKRVEFHLHFNEHCNDFDDGYDDVSNKAAMFFRYSIEMKNGPLTNWKIEIPSSEHFEENPYAKLLDDLNFFICDSNTRIIANNYTVKRLELGGWIFFKSELELRFKLIQALGPGLEELTLSGMFVSMDETPAFTIGLNKLRVFTLSLDNELDDDDFPVTRVNFNWLNQLILAIRGVTTIRLISPCPDDLALTFMTHLYSDKKFKQFPNLNEITIQRLNPAIINLLLKLDFVQPLKKLELFKLMDMKKADFLPFERLLLKHSQSLKSLLFIIPPSPANDEDKDLPPVFLRFPSFPKLERLHVGWGPEVPNKTEDIKLTFSDGTGYINYERDLPFLKSLTLWPLGYGKYPKDPGGVENYAPSSTELGKVWEYSGSFYEMFLPAIVNKEEDDTEQEVETCKTLQFLDILHSLPTSERNKPLFSEVMETAIASMFPKLDTNPWLNSIRERDAAEIKAKAKKVKAKKDAAKKKKTENITPVGRLRLRSSTRKLRPRSRHGGDIGAIKY